MKNQIIQSINRLFVLAVVLTLLAGAALAQHGRERLESALRDRAGVQKQRTAILKAARSVRLSAVDQENLLLGRDFTLAKYDAGFIGEDEEADSYTIIDIVYLMVSLEGQPEAARLQKVLKSIVRGSAEPQAIADEIEAISLAYQARQKKEQKWFFSAGVTTTKLSIAAFLADEAGTKGQIAELDALVRNSPAGVSREFTGELAKIAGYGSGRTLGEEEFVAIFEGIASLVENLAA